MQPLGFSTGALAKGDFQDGVHLSRGCDAVELSALRDKELAALVDAVPSLDLDGFRYVSVHAPSSLKTLTEREVFDLLDRLPKEWPIIAHPDILLTPDLWRGMGARLCIENMDNRKSRGRTDRELTELFDELPEASFCLDVGHARQIDPTMTIALLMLMDHGDRLRQVHVSDVGPKGEHRPLGTLAGLAYASIAKRIPETVPLVIESVFKPCTKESMEREVQSVRKAFHVEGRSKPAVRRSCAPVVGEAVTANAE